MTRLHVHTLGCKVNQVEGEGIAGRAAAGGVRPVSDAAEADVIVLNSCAVTRAADLEAAKLARRYRRANPDAVIVLTGCYAQVRPAEAARLPVDYVVGHGGKDALAGEIAAMAARGRRASAEVRVAPIYRDRRLPVLPPEPGPAPDRTRRIVKVQDGCDVFCSFCIVPHARGLPRSIPAEAALAEIAGHVARGVREIVLTGPHIGSWGRDLSPPDTLASLLRRVRLEGGVSRLRLSSMEPSEFDDAVIDEISRHADVYCEHLHVPLQSGSDAVLRRMRRPYDTARFRDLTERFARALPRLGLGTDVIAGFPGETRAEFEETYTLLEASPVSFFHVFPFSPRPGTPAAKHPNQVPTPLIRARAARLRALGLRKAREFYGRFMGERLEVLLETRLDDGCYRGYSRNYIPVEVSGERLAANTLVQAKLVSAVEGRVRGEAVG
ncbi:MAG: tRNA (N(6)-L-threonylcarbamoyladenosine(37)-C(2))-methylthiotransferase MtaB [Deltaproteobacteria bacterium]|nr:tRNA (N(6)-L-threonylcarbamoyladenosine(37)-C(2))-methylthiotransferase MtaB [Deltaproteobacteria bacterium]